MTDIYRTLMALGQGGQNPAASIMPQQQQTPMDMGMPAAMSAMRRGQQPQSGPQFQQPSWLDLMNQTMMMGSMMPQQMPNNMYGYGMNANNQQPLSNWQKGFQGLGATLNGLSNPLTAAGSTGMSFAQPWAPFALGGGLAAGGLGGLSQFLGQPGILS